jgi:hypothetical protein
MIDDTKLERVAKILEVLDRLEGYQLTSQYSDAIKQKALEIFDSYYEGMVST